MNWMAAACIIGLSFTSTLLSFRIASLERRMKRIEDAHLKANPFSSLPDCR